MATSILIFIVLSFLAVSTQGSTPLHGISAYCTLSKGDGSLFGTLWFPRTPIECCNASGQCDKWIDPGETSYGLRNPDLKHSRRHLTCDQQLYECVTKGMTVSEKQSARRYAFNNVISFRKRRTVVDGVTHVGLYEWVRLLDTIPDPADTTDSNKTRP